MTDHSAGEEHDLIERLCALYREPDVMRELLADPGSHCAGDYLAYRKQPWRADQHLAVVLAREHIESSATILVAGAGAGDQCLHLAASGYWVIGTEILPELCHVATKRARCSPGGERCMFVPVDSFSWPVADNSMGGVSLLSSFVSHCPSKRLRRKLFEEVRRVLRPGGSVLMEALDYTHPSQFSPIPADPSTAKGHLASLSVEPGVIWMPLHPLHGDRRSHTVYPWYFASPIDLWHEVESAGLRPIRMQCEQSRTEAYASVLIVAVAG